MSTCLIELVKPYIQEIYIDEVAAHLKIAVADILELEFWPFALWLRVRRRGAVFVSPRKLSFWLPAIKEAIAGCDDFERLEELKNALEVDFKTKYDRKTQEKIYLDAVQEELRKLVEERWKQIEAETAAFQQAEGLTRSYELIIKQCTEQEPLDWVAQLIRKNYDLLEPFSDLLQQLRRSWAIRRAEILNLSRSNASTFTRLQNVT
jgi:hypothetical protein